jgi:hypothetical protein
VTRPPVPPSPPPLRDVPRLSERRRDPQQWNLWELERVARAEARQAPDAAEGWSYLFLHLRQFADARGTLPVEFDGLVRESFGGLLDRLETR